MLSRSRAGALREAVPGHKTEKNPQYPLENLFEPRVPFSLPELHAVVRRSVPAVERKESKDCVILGKDGNEEQISEEKQPLFGKESVKALISMMGRGRRGFGLQVRLMLTGGGVISYNSVAAKYNQFIAGAVTNNWAAIASSPEFSSLDVLFDEVFIHSVTMVYKARNKYSGTYPASGTATDVGTCLGCFYFLPNGAGAYADSASAYISAAVAAQHKIVNLGENFTWVMRNPVKFGRNDPVVEQGSASRLAMGWMNFSAVTGNYGGFFGLITPLATGAALGIGTLLEGQAVADFILYYDISVRSRA